MSKFSIFRSVCHLQVAERALFLWNNEYIAMMTTDNARVLLPILYPALHRNSKSHWNTTVHSLTFNIIKLYSELDEAYFNQCRKNFEQEEEQRSSHAEERRKLWSGIEAMAKKNPKCDVAADILEDSSKHPSSSSSTNLNATENTDNSDNRRSSVSSTAPPSSCQSMSSPSGKRNSQHRAPPSRNSGKTSGTTVSISDKQSEKEHPEDPVDNGDPVERKCESLPPTKRVTEKQRSADEFVSDKKPSEEKIDSPEQQGGSSVSVPSTSTSTSSVTSNKQSGNSADNVNNEALRPQPLSPQVNDVGVNPKSSPEKLPLSDADSSADTKATPPTVVEKVISKAVTVDSEKNADIAPSPKS